MFVKTNKASEYFPEEQVASMNYGVNDYVNNTRKRDPNRSGINRGQILFTNCTTLNNEEVNALTSFEYSFDPSGDIEYFKVIEIAIYDNDDDEGINYMLEHRKTKDELVREEPAMAEIIKAHANLCKTSMVPSIIDQLREEFNTIGGDYVTGFAALKIIEKIFNSTK